MKNKPISNRSKIYAIGFVLLLVLATVTLVVIHQRTSDAITTQTKEIKQLKPITVYHATSATDATHTDIIAYDNNLTATGAKKYTLAYHERILVNNQVIQLYLHRPKAIKLIDMTASSMPKTQYFINKSRYIKENTKAIKKIAGGNYQLVLFLTSMLIIISVGYFLSSHNTKESDKKL